MTSSSTASSSQNTLDPSMVGGQFLSQYYTFVNKQPNHLHCFYNKNSALTHGTEGKEGKSFFGEQEIQNKHTSLGFEDCKVFVQSTDSQFSANSGIIIQAIGQISNHGEPWRRFVQTFFLAEHAGNYFILNDIFRYLKEDTEEGDGAGESTEFVSPPATPEHANQEPPAELATPESPSTEADKDPTMEPAIAQTTTTVAAPRAAKPTPAVPRTWAGLAVYNQKKPGLSHKARNDIVSALANPGAPQPAAHPAPRSWASLAASNQKKWGARLDHTAPATQSVAHAQCFIKGVKEPITHRQLESTLTTQFGVIKDLEIVRAKACAFLEFTTVESARRAITASLNRQQGGEGGIWVDVGGEVGQIRIYVETKKARSERQPAKPKGSLNGRSANKGGRGGGIPQ